MTQRSRGPFADFRRVGKTSCAPSPLFRFSMIAALLSLLISTLSTIGVGAAGSSRFTVEARPPRTQQPNSIAELPTDNLVDLEIERVSPWVEPDGDFNVAFLPTTDIPPDAQLTVTIHQALRETTDDSLREQVHEIIETGMLGKILQTPITTPVAEIGDFTAGATFTIPIRSSRGDSDRVLLPNAGIHPISLVITEASGPELWRATTFLNRLPQQSSRASQTPPHEVRMFMSVDSDPFLLESGQPQLTLDDELALRSFTTMLSELSDLPITVFLRGHTILGLESIDRIWANTLLDVLKDDSTDYSLSALAFTNIDTGSLHQSGFGDEISYQVKIAQQQLEDTLGRAVHTLAWPPDSTLTTQAFSALEELAIHNVLLSPNQLRRGEGDAPSTSTSGPLPLFGSGALRGHIIDNTMSALLGDFEVEGGSSVHGVTTLLMADWFTNTGSLGAGSSVIQLDASMDPAGIRLLGELLAEPGPLQIKAFDSLPEPNGAPDRLFLEERETSNYSSPMQSVRHTRTLIDSFNALSLSQDSDRHSWTYLNDQSLSMSLEAPQRESVYSKIQSAIDGRVALVQGPPERRIVLTDNHSTIPLRFRNDLEYDVDIRLKLRAARLDIPNEDELNFTLTPGENRIDLPVTIQAAGSSLLRIEVLSPDGGITLNNVDLPVRSTAISGVGTVLAIVSMLLLFVWWFITNRRRNRQASRSTSSHPSESPLDEPTT